MIPKLESWLVHLNAYFKVSARHLEFTRILLGSTLCSLVEGFVRADNYKEAL